MPLVFKVCNVLHWVRYLVMNEFSYIFCFILCRTCGDGWIKFISYLFFIIAYKTLFTLRAFLSLSSSNDAFVDIVDHEGSFELSPKTEFISTCYVTTNTGIASPSFTQLLQDLLNMFKLLAFKWLLNGLLFERECSLVILIW